MLLDFLFFLLNLLINIFLFRFGPLGTARQQFIEEILKLLIDFFVLSFCLHARGDLRRPTLVQLWRWYRSIRYRQLFLLPSHWHRRCSIFILLFRRNVLVLKLQRSLLERRCALGICRSVISGIWEAAQIFISFFNFLFILRCDLLLDLGLIHEASTSDIFFGDWWFLRFWGKDRSCCFRCNFNELWLNQFDILSRMLCRIRLLFDSCQFRHLRLFFGERRFFLLLNFRIRVLFQIFGKFFLGLNRGCWAIWNSFL